VPQCPAPSRSPAIIRAALIRGQHEQKRFTQVQHAPIIAIFECPPTAEQLAACASRGVAAFARASKADRASAADFVNAARAGRACEAQLIGKGADLQHMSTSEALAELDSLGGERAEWLLPESGARLLGDVGARGCAIAAALASSLTEAKVLGGRACKGPDGQRRSVQGGSRMHIDGSGGAYAAYGWLVSGTKTFSLVPAGAKSLCALDVLGVPLYNLAASPMPRGESFQLALSQAGAASKLAEKCVPVRSIVLRAGDRYAIPPGMAHEVKNEGDTAISVAFGVGARQAGATHFAAAADAAFRMVVAAAASMPHAPAGLLTRVHSGYEIGRGDLVLHPDKKRRTVERS
jgi:hypothetical protein